jgi:hypothetical protein
VKERPIGSGSVVGGESRKGYLPTQARAANDGGGLVVMSVADLRDAIRDAITEASEGKPRSGSRLLDRHGIADALACSPAQVDRLRKTGMPCLYVGESPRFVFEDCVRWLGEQKGGAL